MITISNLTSDQLIGLEFLHARDGGGNTDTPLAWFEKKIDWDLNFHAIEAKKAAATVLGLKVAALPEEDREIIADIVDSKTVVDVPIDILPVNP